MIIITKKERLCMEYQNIIFEKANRISTITMNRPHALNALNYDTLKELDNLLDLIKTENETDVIILTGSGTKSFIAGADIREMSNLTPETARAFAIFGQRVFKKFEDMNIPVIAAVNGFALGGGCEIALACDIILATPNSKFGQPEVNLGLIPGFGGTQRLFRAVGPSWAKYMIYTGETLSVEDALRIGLVLKIIPSENLLEEARKIAETITKKAALAVKYSKKAILFGYDSSLDEGLELEASLFEECFKTSDQKEGMDAFLNKRKPNFQGK